MSNTITNFCRPLKLSPPQKCVLMALADRADDSGLAWPSIAWLCEWTCFGKTAVIGALKGLEEGKLITTIRTAGRNNYCTLDLDRIVEMTGQQAQAAAKCGSQDGSAEDVNPSATRTSPPDEPVRQTDYHPSATRTTTSPPGEPTRPPGAPDTSLNTSKTSNRQGEARGAPPITELDGVPSQVMADYLAVRKAKKAGGLTATALASIQREANKAGLSLEQAITECCEAGWQGFKADWYFRRHGIQSPTAAGAQRVRELVL